MQRLSRASLLSLVIAGACADVNVDDPRANLPVVSLDRAPPPVAGGTLTVLRDARTAVVSDPDHHAVRVVDLLAGSVRTVTLAQGEEPGRAVEDASGRVHVVLRREGSLLTLDAASGAERARRKVCTAPRGVAYHPGEDALYVSCAYGELVRLPAAGGAELGRYALPADLRDVVVRDGRVYVSRFRSAELLSVGADGAVTARARPPIATLTSADDEAPSTQRYEPSVAWRTVALGDAGLLMVHQRGLYGPEAVPPPDQDYSYSRNNPTWRDPCGNSVVHSTLTVFSPEGRPRALPGRPVEHGVLPVDVAVSPAGDKVAVAFASELSAFYAQGPQVIEVSAAEATAGGSNDCLAQRDPPRYPGQAVAVAYAGGELAVQLRQPSQVFFRGRSIVLSSEPTRDTGHDLFHTNAGGGVACASCHPEGGDDGRVWEFRATGPRRTQTLENGVSALARLHWAGDVDGMRALMDTTLTRRMTGPSLSDAQVSAAARWMRSIRAVPSVTEQPAAEQPAQVRRGREVFEGATAACASCHSGELMSDGALVTLGARAWRVAPLRGLGVRAPYMHDGCGTTLRAALEGGDGCAPHGNTLRLTGADRDALYAYLRAL